MNKLSQRSNQVIGSCTSCIFLGGSCTFQASNIIVELGKLIQMIIKTYFLCWRGDVKNLCSGFHQVSKRSKTIKNHTQMFLAFETRWNPRNRFWNITKRTPAILSPKAAMIYRLDFATNLLVCSCIIHFEIRPWFGCGRTTVKLISLPQKGFGPEAKTRGGTLKSPACIHTGNFKKVRNVLVVFSIWWN